MANGSKNRRSRRHKTPNVAVEVSESEKLREVVKSINAAELFNSAMRYLDENIYDKAIECLRESVKMGSAEAMNCLGLCYKDGLGVRKSSAEAFEWFMRAAEAGNREGMHNLSLYLRREGSSEALELLQQVGGIADLGKCLKGAEVACHDDKVFELELESAKAGILEAMHNVGACYALGKGVLQDISEGFKWFEKAFEWYLKAAEKGFTEAMFRVGMCYDEGEGVQKNLDEAFKWMLRAAEKGHVEAMYNVGVYYEKGEGVSRDDKKAFEWYEKAANQGSVYAMYRAGYIYYSEPIDYNKAGQWFSLAAEKGDKDAEEVLRNNLRYNRFTKKWDAVR